MAPATPMIGVALHRRHDELSEHGRFKIMK
jgi:hypothetical protein